MFQRLATGVLLIKLIACVGYSCCLHYSSLLQLDSEKG